jgi:hypothetical protein
VEIEHLGGDRRRLLLEVDEAALDRLSPT